MPEQTYKNHARINPAYHFVVFFTLLAGFVWSGIRLWRALSVDTAIAMAVSFGLVVMFFSVRRQVLTVQDRVIRLEMLLRIRQLLPADLAAQAAGLPVGHLVALRFGSDAELEDLVREVLAGRLTTQKAIKLQVKNWQSDFLRA